MYMYMNCMVWIWGWIWILALYCVYHVQCATTTVGSKLKYIQNYTDVRRHYITSSRSSQRLPKDRCAPRRTITVVFQSILQSSVHSIEDIGTCLR